MPWPGSSAHRLDISVLTRGGLLTDSVRKHPYSVLLLDEIEKAHIDLFNILLQVMDHATLTDNNGKKADFRNVIMMMTSNAGSREMSSSTIGFGDPKKGSGAKGKKAVEKYFSPEFPQPPGRHHRLQRPRHGDHGADRR